jgi:hypothetical protein
MRLSRPIRKTFDILLKHFLLCLISHMLQRLLQIVYRLRQVWRKFTTLHLKPISFELNFSLGDICTSNSHCVVLVRHFESPCVFRQHVL